MTGTQGRPCLLRTEGLPLTISVMAALECCAAEKIMSRASEGVGSRASYRLNAWAGGRGRRSLRLGKVASGLL